MEFVELSKYSSVTKENFLPFAELRKMKPILLTHDLQLVNETDNVEYVKKLASEGIAIVPIRRKPPYAKFAERNTFPRRILFEMTSRCNFLCRMCPQQNLTRPRMDMPGETYRRVLDEIDEHGVEGLWLYHLGESILHPEFKENLAHASSKNNLGVIWMSTNGQFFTEDVARAILASKIDFVNYSMHAVTEETYNTVALPGAFSEVQNNLFGFYKLKEAQVDRCRPFIHCQMIEQETTAHEVDAFLRLHYKKADIVSVNMLEYVNLPNNHYGTKQRERTPLTSCLRVSRNDCFICSNGAVTLCDAAYNGEILLGNIHEESLYDIWNGEKHKRILELNQAGKMGEIEFCRTCTDYDI